jgi:hypothetical protein
MPTSYGISISDMTAEALISGQEGQGDGLSNNIRPRGSRAVTIKERL